MTGALSRRETEPPDAPVSFEEFLAWAPDQVQAEWVDGDILIMSPASTEHQRLHGFLFTLLRLFVELRQLGEVFSAPFLMRLPARPSGREPDIVFLATEHADRLRETYLDGPADLVVEIVSPESDARDRGEKFVEYEAAGIPEYWLIDPTRREGWFYRLGSDQRYHAAPLEPNGRYHSTVLPGFNLQLGWLWQRPLPAVLQLLQQLEA
jgi:Uma2 family endonuclease